MFMKGESLVLNRIMLEWTLYFMIFSLLYTYSTNINVTQAWQLYINVCQVIGGYYLPKKGGDRVTSILDPYIKLTILGVPEDKKEARTRTVTDNGTKFLSFFSR